MTEFAERKCLSTGSWDSGPDTVTIPSLLKGSDYNSQGWTNYNNCFLPEIRDLLEHVGSGTQEAEVHWFDLWPYTIQSLFMLLVSPKGKMMVAYVTRVLELTGLTASLISLIISLFIFSYFRYTLSDWFCCLMVSLLPKLPCLNLNYIKWMLLYTVGDETRF